MRVLVYKRTHTGDPDTGGRFGCNDCMGRVRSWDFDAVIGVGGIGSEARDSGIAGKVNWIGIGALRTLVRGKADPIVTFTHFKDLSDDNLDFGTEAPTLAKRLYGKNIRATMTFSAQENAEIRKLLAIAEKAPSSSKQHVRAKKSSKTLCQPSHCQGKMRKC